VSGIVYPLALCVPMPCLVCALACLVCAIACPGLYPPSACVLCAGDVAMAINTVVVDNMWVYIPHPGVCALSWLGVCAMDSKDSQIPVCVRVCGWGCLVYRPGRRCVGSALKAVVYLD
jgi:hypothetical protein